MNERRFRLVQRACFAGAVAIVLTAGAARTERLFPIVPPPVLRMEGFIDRLPEQAKDSSVVAEIPLSANGLPTRKLLVTHYQSNQAILLNHLLSLSLVDSYRLIGKREDVEHVLKAPPGTEIKGVFVFYFQGYPSVSVTLEREPESR